MTAAIEQRARVRDFLSGLLARKGDCRTFADSDPLGLHGRIDSMDVLEVVQFLEGDFGIDFSAIEFDQTRLGSVDEIMALIASG